ncbi:hypothetical protein Vadar_019885 [Vaccinium darrowii]|uniref:Uncharacterized protein n=1 Tax=Vaccinium darrowii TaxID=229202 RepID=A0ACB7XJY8_9ERIC|nr:hypothetical protein Vadar_019885 [Vaccinium darrowii]
MALSQQPSLLVNRSFLGFRYFSLKGGKINGNFAKNAIKNLTTAVTDAFSWYRKAVGLQIEAFWKRNSLVLLGAVGVMVYILLWRILFGIANTFIGLSEGMAKYGFLALSSAIVAFSGLYLRTRFTVNPDKVYRMAMRRLNTDAGILEVMGAPLSRTDLRAYVMSGGGISLKNFKPAFRKKRCLLIFPIRAIAGPAAAAGAQVILDAAATGPSLDAAATGPSPAATSPTGPSHAATAPPETPAVHPTTGSPLSAQVATPPPVLHFPTEAPLPMLPLLTPVVAPRAPYHFPTTASQPELSVTPASSSASPPEPACLVYQIGQRRGDAELEARVTESSGREAAVGKWYDALGAATGVGRGSIGREASVGKWRTGGGVATWAESGEPVVGCTAGVSGGAVAVWEGSVGEVAAGKGPVAAASRECPVAAASRIT